MNSLLAKSGIVRKYKGGSYPIKLQLINALKDSSNGELLDLDAQIEQEKINIQAKMLEFELMLGKKIEI